MTYLAELTKTGFETAEQVLVGVVADTHYPDRVNALHPQLLPVLKSAGVQLILHAGDICTTYPLEKLNEIAPVIAVRGNRDWAFSKSLPLARKMEIAGHQVAMVHGHGRWSHYLINKVKMLLQGYNLDIFVPAITEPAPDAEIIVFGHTHRAVNFWYNQRQLLFNPGPCSLVARPAKHPSIGLLRFEKNRPVMGEIVLLEQATLKNRRWVTER
ncbi:MAG: metallophosphatase family protein [Anaerolineae bacterium]|nr:metallophosphatase family protein [Anaerolineae bacterium]